MSRKTIADSRFRLLLVAFFLVAVVGCAIQAVEPQTPVDEMTMQRWEDALRKLIEQAMTALFLLSVLLPFVLPAVMRMARTGWVWCFVIVKRCFYPAMALLVLGVVLWALISLPGPWRPALRIVGLDPAYYDNLEMEYTKDGLYGIGKGVALGSQILLLVAAFLLPSLAGGLCAWLLHGVLGLVLSPRARSSRRLREISQLKGGQ